MTHPALGMLEEALHFISEVHVRVGKVPLMPCDAYHVPSPLENPSRAGYLRGWHSGIGGDGTRVTMARWDWRRWNEGDNGMVG